MKGFMIFEGGKPVAIELNDDICGLTDDPFPVFADAEDAKQAFLAEIGRYSRYSAVGQIIPVTITLGEPVQEVLGADHEEDLS